MWRVGEAKPAWSACRRRWATAGKAGRSAHTCHAVLAAAGTPNHAQSQCTCGTGRPGQHHTPNKVDRGWWTPHDTTRVQTRARAHLVACIRVKHVHESTSGCDQRPARNDGRTVSAARMRAGQGRAGQGTHLDRTSTVASWRLAARCGIDCKLASTGVSGARTGSQSTGDVPLDNCTALETHN